MTIAPPKPLDAPPPPSKPLNGLKWIKKQQQASIQNLTAP